MDEQSSSMKLDLEKSVLALLTITTAATNILAEFKKAGLNGLLF
jgi:hypothetical protein